MLRSIGKMRRDPLSFLDEQWRMHGDVVQFPIPRPATYLLSDPAAVRSVLVDNSRHESKRTLQYDNLALITGDGLLTADDPPWRERRRVIQPSFHHGELAGVAAHTNVVVGELVEKWQRLPAGTLVDVDEAMMALALQVVAGALFGSDWRAQADELTAATVVALDCVVRRARNPIPISLRIPTPENLRLRRAREVLNRAVGELIRRRVDEPSTGTLIDHLIGGLRTPVGDVDVQAVRDEVVTFLVAGHETVASALTWTWHCLGQSPVARRALFDEVDQVAASDAASEQSRLPYTHALIDEVLRLYPPAWVITRKSHVALEFADHDVPTGSLLIMSPWIVHRHPSIWSEPNQFIPERFLRNPSRNHPGYLPFGLGPRMCIGRDFALVESVAVVAGIAREIQLDANGSKVDVLASVTMRPADGLKMRVTPRR